MDKLKIFRLKTESIEELKLDTAQIWLIVRLRPAEQQWHMSKQASDQLGHLAPLWHPRALVPFCQPASTLSSVQG